MLPLPAWTIVERLAAGATTRAVGAEFGLSRQRINQIKHRITGAPALPTRVPLAADRTARLRVLWRQGLSSGEIARHLGVSRNAVIGKIYRLRSVSDSA
jgi:GcrA cell cycle regulator